MMVKHAHTNVVFAPLYIHRAKVVLPHTLSEAEKFNIRYFCPSGISSTADKLRWHRYQKGLLQSDVADHIGIDRVTYSSYEAPGRDYYPIDTLLKLAGLFDVDILDLMDEYNVFLHKGQGWQIKALRTQLGLSQREFAALHTTTVQTIKRWEGDRAQIFKSTWRKLFGK